MNKTNISNNVAIPTTFNTYGSSLDLTNRDIIMKTSNTEMIRKNNDDSVSYEIVNNKFPEKEDIILVPNPLLYPRSSNCV